MARHGARFDEPLQAKAHVPPPGVTHAALVRVSYAMA
jgi:hypothetical protein